MSARDSRRSPIGRDAERGSGQWRDVVGYEGVYRVSRTGQVYSCRAGRLLTPVLVKGYPSVRLSVRGRRVSGRVHRLVAMAFLGAPPAGKLECAHIDGNPLNNSADNLMWASRVENEGHKRGHGTARLGERSPHAKLSNDQAQIIRSAARRLLTRSELARLVGVSEDTIYDILSGKSYNG